MSVIVVGWYLPVFILMVCDPLVRDILKETCVQGSHACAKGAVAFVRWGGIALVRKVAVARRFLQQTETEHSDEWVAVD